MTVAGKFSCYQFIFQQQYDFQIAARTLESVLQRLREFIFLLYSNPSDNSVIPVILIQPDTRELFNNVMHITLVPYPSDSIFYLLRQMNIYAELRLRQHYAIPFCSVPEPFPLYRILADYYYSYPVTDTHTHTATTTTTEDEDEDRDNVDVDGVDVDTPALVPSSSSHSYSSSPSSASSSSVILFALHAKQRSERISIASFLRKHDLARTSTFYAYADQIRAKLQSAHYHCTLLLACSDSRTALQKALTAFRVSHFSYYIRSNNSRSPPEKQRLMKKLLRRPKKPCSIPLLSNPARYPVLSSVEVVSLMLPDSVKGVRTAIDGIRPYTTGKML